MNSISENYNFSFYIINKQKIILILCQILNHNAH